jgi:hypothetical protein
MKIEGMGVWYVIIIVVIILLLFSYAFANVAPFLLTNSADCARPVG